MSRLSIQWRQRLLPAALVVLVSMIAFLPFARRLGFYRDDWYMLWSANTRGANSIIELFSIDRPFMGYTYDLTYRVLGDSPLNWQIYSFVLKTLGALAVYGILRLLWPEQGRAATAGALIYLVYPGFLGQPNAATKTNQLLSLTSELYSIWRSGLAVSAQGRGKRIALVCAALPLGLLNYLLYEYMIGLEALRVCVLWLIPQQSETLDLRGRVWRFLKQWVPYLGLALVFLVWRLGFFKSGRGGTDQISISKSVLSDPRGFLVHIGLQSVLDPIESAFMAWWVPFENYASVEKPRLVANALLAGALVAALALTALWLEKRLRKDDEEGSGRSRALEVCIAGGLSLYGAIFPVLVAGRDATFSGGYDKYTLHASPAVAILLAGLLFGFVRGRGRPALLALLLVMGVATHTLNMDHWQRFWENEKSLWWQLTWRAPGLQDGTILVASIPEEGLFEDYELWGPANLIYRPGVQTVTIGSEILNEDTIYKIWVGADEMRGMRKLDYERDFNKTLLLALPGDSSCLKVVDRDDLSLPLRYEPRLAPILRYSHTEQIDLSAPNPAPPPDIFGPEPPHDWCYYYQSAERAKQAGDWATVIKLGDQALAASLTPVDRAEWLPFLEGYLWAGDQAKVDNIAHRLDFPLVKQVCDALTRGQFRFGPEIQQGLQQALCGD